MSSAELASLPFADLTTRIDALLCEGGEEPLPIRVEELLDALAGMPDHEPLGYALRRLAAQGRLEGSRAGFLSGLLAALPDTGLQRVLRGLEPARLSGEARAAVVEAAAAALQRLPLERLAALALLAGWLKRAAPELEAACTQAALQRCRAAVRPEALRDEDLALLPGRALVALAERPGFGTRLETFCERALDILQRAPRSLSQANAEELLSRRVYIEPGHFLFELLQNAADAGARRVSVAIEPDRVLFAHDGQPFDLRDVVGVLSIGQSSKRKEQIGFFGVGFKSVYGICERPQVHSGLFSFEIADVSMPRRLAGPPPEAQVGETLLLLPLRDPADSARNAAAVTRFAGQIPPETLLTMPGLAELRLYSPGRHEIVQRRQEGTAGPVSLLLAAQGECRRYHVAARDESYAGQRESRRAAQSPLLVALRLDEQGLPTPLAAGPTLFAYLPTREAAGLRFLVHAHFDLPVDRERLERGSPFNRWLLGRAGELLAGELCRLLRAQPAGAPRRLWACRLLQLLPLPEELPDPLFHELKLALRDGLAAQPVLPGAAGEWLRPAPSLAPFAPSLAPSLALSSTPSLAPSSTPSSTSLPAATAPAGVGAGDAPLAGALLEPPVLALALAGLPLGPAGRRALAPLPGRAAAVAVSLGVPRLAAAELPQLLGHLLAGAVAGDPAPAWLMRPISAAAEPPDPAAWAGAGAEGEGVCKVVVGEAGAGGAGAAGAAGAAGVGAGEAGAGGAGAAGVGAGEAGAGGAVARPALAILLDELAGLPGAVRALQELPLLVDGEGRLRRGAELALGDRLLCSLYAGARPFIAAALADGAGPERLSLLLGLGVRSWGPAELLDDLDDADLARRLVGSDGGRSLWGYLAQLPPALLRRAGELPLAPDRQGRLLPLAGPGERCWLTPADPLGAWLEALLPVAPWALVDAGLQAEHQRVLELAGAERSELVQVVRALEQGELLLDTATALWLHRLLHQRREELGPGLCRRLALLPIHPDREGVLRSLAGEGRTLRPVDTAIVRALPWLPWLHPGLAGLAHLPLLDPAPLGPEGLVRSLVGDGPALVEPGGDPARLDGALSYLCAHGGEVPRALAKRLSDRPIWRAADGSLHRLAELRRQPGDPLLAEIYGAWGAFSAIAEGPGSPAELAAALGLDAGLREPDLASLVLDLAASPPDSADAPWRPRLLAALRRAAGELSRRELLPLRQVALYADEQGRLRSLALCPGEAGGGALLWPGPGLRPALRGLGLPLLGEEDGELLGPLLRTLGVAPQGPLELVELLVEGHRPATWQGWATLRQSLAAAGDELAALPPRGDALRLLSELPLWPSATGELLPARRLVRGRELGRMLGGELQGLAELIPPGRRLAGEAEEEAEQLAALLPFAAGADILLEELAGQLVPERPLVELPPPLGGERAVVALLGRLRRAGWDVPRLAALPLGVDAAGRLARLPLLAPTEPTRALLADLDGGEQAAGREALQRLRRGMASASWAREAERELAELLKPLPAPRLLELFSTLCSEERAVAEHPWLSGEESRRHLYAWLLAEARAIEAEPAARSLLGRLPLFRTAGGRMRAARDLLLDPSLPDLGLGWELHPEVPEELTAWLRRLFRLDQARLRPMVDALVEGHGLAVEAGDLLRAARLLRVLARALLAGGAPTGDGADAPSPGRAAGGGQPPSWWGMVEALALHAPRHRLHRRLRVPGEDGHPVRPRELFLPGVELRALLPWLDPPPVCIAAAYGDAESQALLVAAGAHVEPPTEQLEGLLAGEGLRPAAAARTALACYLVRRIGREPVLYEALGLARRSWVPEEGSGRLCRPGELLWPETELDALLGPSGGRRPDPEVRWSIADRALAGKVGFVLVEELDLATVAAALRPGDPAGEALLRWLDDGLRGQRFSAEQLRVQVAGRLWLADERGQPRPLGQLVRAGARELCGTRRGSWPEAERFSKLASALRIPPRPGLPELLDICAELAAELSARQAAGLAEQGGAAPDLLAQEPELLHWLPACLERLVELGAEPPPRLPLVVQQASGGALAVLLAPSGRLFLPEPGELADAARSAALDLCFPALIDLEPPVTRWLAGLGLGDLWGIWSVHRMRWEEQQAEERGWTQLERALAALGRLAPELRGHPAVAAAWCWDPLRWPERVVPVRRLQAEGELGGASITVTLPCALDPDGGHLLATTLLLEDPLPLAWLLLRSRILDAPVPAELAEEVACMLRTGDAGPLRRLLQPAGAPLAGPGKEAAAQAEAGAEAVLQQGAAALRGAGALPPEQGRPAEVNRPSPAAPSFPAQKPRAPAGRQEGPAAKPRVPVRAPAQDRAQPPPRAPAPVRGTARAQERPTREPTELSPPPARPPAGPGLLERLRRLWQRPEPPAAARRSQAGTAGEQPEAGEAAEAGPRSPARRPPASPPRGRTSAGDPRALPPLDDQGRPSGASDEGSWFSPRGSVEPQLRSAAAWLADRGRAPTLGFAFAPPRLPLPWLYAPKLVGERFERRGQRWVEAGAPAVWGRPAGPGTGELVLRGRVPAGEVLLPLPHYGRLLSVEADPPPRLLSLPDGRSLLVAKQPLELICRVALDEPPRFEEGGDEPPDAPHHLLDPTVPDHELPEELHAALAALQASPIGPLPRALALRDLVRRRYRYDPSYMERPELATWLAELAAGRPNAHLAVLHAGRDAEVLGRGVCYELNVLLCELLRRCGFPAAVATGWVLDGGSLADPDHLWALALLPTPQGPRWLPLDASSTEQGRPLRVGRRPPGRWRPPSSRGLGAVRAPSWSSGRASAGSAAAVAEALARRELPLLELERVARHLEQQAGRPPLEAVRLRRHLRDILEDPARLRALLELLWPDRL